MKLSILVEKAVVKADFDRETFDELVTAAQTALDSARAMGGDAVDMAEKSLSDFNILVKI